MYHIETCHKIAEINLSQLELFLHVVSRVMGALLNFHVCYEVETFTNDSPS